MVPFWAFLSVAMETNISKFATAGDGPLLGLSIGRHGNRVRAGIGGVHSSHAGFYGKRQFYCDFDASSKSWMSCDFIHDSSTK